MYLTQSNQIKGLPQTDYEVLREMCRYAKNLYLGLDDLATCVNSADGSSFIIDGKYLKSLTHQYNRRLAQLQSILDQQHLSRSEQMARITITRNHHVKGVMMKAARSIVNYCLAHRIGTIVVGYNPDGKHGANMGQRNTQHFVQIPPGQLRNQLETRCDRYGIHYVEQEDSDTSKASFLDGDAIPLWNGTHQTVLFSGKRGQRGVYRTKAALLNADVNGATNIFRKSNHRLDFERVARGLLANPLRVKLTSVGSS